MPRTNTGFKKSDVVRAIAGARAAGIAVARVEIDARNQRITIIAGDLATSSCVDLDTELAAFEARNEGHP